MKLSPKKIYLALLAPVSAAIASILISSLALLATKKSPVDAFKMMWEFGATTSSVIETLNSATSYYIAAIAIASNSSITISNLAVKMLNEVFEEGEIYKKAGVIVTNIIPESQKQFHLFEEENPKHLKLMQVMDDYYKKTGERKIKLANQDLTRTWTMKQEHLSKKYTTDINEILKIPCR